MLRLGGLVRGGLASGRFVTASVMWASLREAMVLFGLLFNRPRKKMSIKLEPPHQVTNLYAQYRVNGHMQWLVDCRTSLNMRFPVGKAKCPSFGRLARMYWMSGPSSSICNEIQTFTIRFNAMMHINARWVVGQKHSVCQLRVARTCETTGAEAL